MRAGAVNLRPGALTRVSTLLMMHSGKQSCLSFYLVTP